MDIETIKNYCAGKKGVTSDYPFDSETLVYRVMGKIFVLIPVEASPPSMNLKCDPTRAEILRQTYPAVTPGYHMNKRHWNTVVLDGSVPDDEVFDMVDHSYDLIVKSLTKAQRQQLEDLAKKK